MPRSISTIISRPWMAMGDLACGMSNGPSRVISGRKTVVVLSVKDQDHQGALLLSFMEGRGPHQLVMIFVQGRMRRTRTNYAVTK